MEKKINLKEIIKDMLPAIILSVAISFMLMLYAPLELYLTNTSEFWFDLSILLPVLLGMFFALCIGGIIIFVIFRVINKKLYNISLVFAFILNLCTYIQGNYLAGNLPPLDGTDVDWTPYDYQRIITIVMWVLITAVVCILIKKFGIDKCINAGKIVTACIFLMLFVTIVSLALTSKGKDDAQMCVTSENQFVMSDDTNFIILVLDALDAKEGKKVIEGNSRYSEALKDFTCYNNAMSMYPFTKHSIPYIVSGDLYENDEPFEDYLKKVYGESKFMSDLEKKGYDLCLYESELGFTDECLYRFDNIKEAKSYISSMKDFVKLQIKLVGFKYAPYDLKSKCVVNNSQFNELKVAVGVENFTENNVEFYKGVKEKEIEISDNKQFKFIHIEGAHVPLRYNSKVEVIEDATYETNVEASLTIASDYIDKLKKSGVYDNSVIIIMADHGYNMYETKGRQNPALFVKGINETHEKMPVSEAPVSYMDLNVAYERLEAGSKSDEIFDCKENEERERRYLFYYHKKEDYMVEFIQKGHASDETTMYQTDKVFEYKN